MENHAKMVTALISDECRANAEDRHSQVTHVTQLGVDVTTSRGTFVETGLFAEMNTSN